MDLMEHVSPTFSMTVNYEAYNGLTSSVRADLFNLDNETLLTVGTEIDDNQGPSITNSVECFAKRIKQLFPTFKNYQFIECYRWQGEPPTFDKITFVDEGFEKPSWQHLDDEQIYHLIEEINDRQFKSLADVPKQPSHTEGKNV